MSQAIFITLTARTDKNYYCYLFHISYAAARFLCERENSQYSLSSFLLYCHLFTLAAAEAQKVYARQASGFSSAKSEVEKITKILSLMQERANTQQQQNCAPAVSLQKIYMYETI